MRIPISMNFSKWLIPCKTVDALSHLFEALAAHSLGCKEGSFLGCFAKLTGNLVWEWIRVWKYSRIVGILFIIFHNSSCNFHYQVLWESLFLRTLIMVVS